jgi:uncharacterized protein (DUF488 family)
MLNSFSISHLADIRSYPGSRRYPHFNKEALQNTLVSQKIDYIHLPELGGRRKPRINSPNSEWKSEGFRGYADYMETEEFKKGVVKLEAVASKARTAYMCSEALWWKCHRSLVSDYLKFVGWTVFHIIEIRKENEHSYTKPAKIKNGELTYH